MIVDILCRLAQKYLGGQNLYKMSLFIDQQAEFKATQMIMYFISSIPTSMIIYASVSQKQTANLGLAFVRCLKLYRLRQLDIQFDVLDIRSNKGSFVRTMQATIYILLITHFLSCFWLFMPRVDPQSKLTWFVFLKYDKYDVPQIQMYIDAVTFIIASMTSIGFFMIYPRTDLEYAMQSVIMLIGVSVYANFFAFFIVSIYDRNRKEIENMMRFEEFKQLAVLRHFPKNIRIQTREYYNSLRLKYDALSNKFEILNELPNCLRGEMSLFINSELIQKINFFQFADPNFILRISTCFQPQLCLQDSYVVRLGEVANKMFFIKTGIVQVLATDNKTTIAYMSDGAYFGEIGVLLTQKRTCSIISNTVSIFYTISKEQLTEILQEFPLQMKYLRAVAKQRLKTTNPEDICDQDNNFQSSTLLKLQMIPQGKYQSQTSRDNELGPLEELYQEEDQLKYHLTETYRSVSYFIVIPLSRFFNVWSFIYSIVISYNLLYVPLAIGLDFQITGLYYIIDIAALIITIIDSMLRPFLAINRAHEIKIERGKLLKKYIKNQLLLDLLASIPFDYIMMMTIENSVYIRYIRLLRILKSYRFIEMINIIKKHATINIPVFNIVLVFLIYIVVSHWFTCLLLLSCRWEYNMDRRYDGNTLYRMIPVTSYLPISQMSKLELYFNMLLFGVGFMCSTIYGDIIQFTISEEIVTIIEMLVGRVFVALCFAEIASYVGQKYQAYTEHMRKSKLVLKWVKINELDYDVNDRIQRYFENAWVNEKGIQENQLINDVPSALKKNINNFIFDELIQNCTLFPKDNYGAITTITSHLEKKLIPKEEFIIKQGELAKEMFFIMRGEVNVITQSGIKLATLKKNQYFGEMALISNASSVRSTSIIAETNVTMAVLTSKNFRMICQHYPEFRTRIKQIVIQRTKDSLNKGASTPNVQNSDFVKYIQSLQLRDSHQLSMIEEESKRESVQEQFNKSSGSSSQHLPENATNKQLAKHISFQIDSQQASFVSPRNETQIQQKISSSLTQMNQKPFLEIIEDNEENKNFDSNNSEEIKQEDNSELPQEEDIYQSESMNTNTLYHASSKIINKHNEQETIEETDLDLQNAIPFYSQRSLRSSPTKNSVDNKIRHVPLMSSSTSNFEEYLYQFKVQQGQNRVSFTSMFLFYAFKYLLLFPLSLYNIVFIPLQMAFIIQFTGWYLFAEILTLLCYSLDVYFAAKHFKQLNNQIININQGVQTEAGSLEKDDIENKITYSKIELIVSVLATLPFSLIFQQTQSILSIVNFLRTLRILKLLPLYKVLQHLKKFNVKAVRLLEILICYYIVSHICSCVLISVAQAFKSDIANTWMNKIPIPLPLGTFQTDIDSVNWYTQYNHAIYFVANTLSHQAIGDLVPVSTDERALFGVMILLLTFFYAFLFANIASIFIDGNNFLIFHERYQHVLQAIPKNRLSEQLLKKISTYYEYLWATSQGHDEQKEIFRVLPAQLMYDVMRQRFQEGFENSLIFKNVFNESDEAIMNSFINLMQIRVFMPRDFIVKAGSHSKQLFIILDGQAVLVGINNDLIGKMRSGSHFHQDIGSGCTSKEVYYGKQIVHLVSQTICTVGIIEESDLLQLYGAFPLWKGLLIKLNSFTFSLAKVCLSDYVSPLTNVQDKFNVEIEALEDHLTLSDDLVYAHILHIIENDHQLSDLNSKEVNKNDLILNQSTMLDNQVGIKSNQKPSFELSNILKRKRTTIQQLFSERLKIKIKSTKCNDRLSRISFNRSSKTRTILDFIHMINLVYIAIAVPFHVAFLPKLENSVALFFESLSIALQVMEIFVNLRTPIVYEGEHTLKFMPILKQYIKKGLILDLMGALPLNILLGYKQLTSINIVVLAILRLTRLLSVVRLFDLMERFQIFLMNQTIIMVFFKGILLLILILHWTSSGWYLVNILEQGSYEYTWLQTFQIDQKMISQQYLLCCYYVVKIWAQVGQSDMIAYNNLERNVFILIINIGDVLFAISLGLIAQVQMHIYDNSEFQKFQQKMKKIEEFLENISSDAQQRKKVQQYFSYKFFSKNKRHLVDASDLLEYLPETLVREILYETSKDVLTPMFQEFNSVNLVKELAFILKNMIFMPGDYIIQKDQIGEEMYFILEGTVNVIGGDKSTVIKTLTKGSYFGEIAIFMKTKRTAYVKAQTFCIISILKKPDIDKIVLSFPSVSDQFANEALRRVKETEILERMKFQNKYNTAQSQSDNESIDESFLAEVQQKMEAQILFSDRTHQILTQKINASTFAQSQIIQKHLDFKGVHNLDVIKDVVSRDFENSPSQEIKQSVAEKFRIQRKSIRLQNVSPKKQDDLVKQIKLNFGITNINQILDGSSEVQSNSEERKSDYGSNQISGSRNTDSNVAEEDNLLNTALKIDLGGAVNTSFEKFIDSPISNHVTEQQAPPNLGVNPDILSFKRISANRRNTVILPDQNPRLIDQVKPFVPVQLDSISDLLKKRNYSKLLFKHAIETEEVKNETKTIRCEGKRKPKRRLSQIQMAKHMSQIADLKWYK